MAFDQMFGGQTLIVILVVIEVNIGSSGIFPHTFSFHRNIQQCPNTAFCDQPAESLSIHLYFTSVIISVVSPVTHVTLLDSVVFCSESKVFLEEDM